MLRSITLATSSLSSRLRICEGDSSSSTTTSSMSLSLHIRASSSVLPEPMNVRTSGALLACIILATTTPPAVSTRFSSSSSERMQSSSVTLIPSYIPTIATFRRFSSFGMFIELLNSIYNPLNVKINMRQQHINVRIYVQTQKSGCHALKETHATPALPKKPRICEFNNDEI